MAAQKEYCEKERYTADRVGQQFGNYRLVRLLGKGGFAEVYLGEHIHLGTQAAIKLLTAELTSKEIEQFYEEARLIAHLEHDHIVPILDFGIENTVPYLVMKYAPNGTLRKRHPKGTRVSLTTVIAYAKQIAPALQYAHFRKYIHRDVKPENILLGPNDKIWLSDFGIAALAHNTSSLNTQGYAGTAIYSAPEQIQGKPRPASDQYSLGIIIYEWLTGTPPFRGDFLYVTHQHIHTPPSSLREKEPTISPEIERVVLRALSKEPEQRYASVSEFAKELERAYQDERHALSMSPIRKATAGTLLHSYEVPQGSVYSFSWMQNKPRLATGDAEGKIEAWDFITGSLFSQQIEGQIEQISWSPNGHYLACLFWSQNELTTKLQLWNLETGNCFATYPKALGPLIWSPDSTCIAFHSYKNNPQDDYGQYLGREPFSYQHWLDGYVYKNQIFQIWDIDRAQLISTVSTFRGSTGELIPLNKAINSLQDFRRLPRPVWSPDSKHIAFSPRVDPSGRWVIPVYEVATGNFITAYPLQHNPAAPPKAYFKQLWSVEEGTITWSPDAAYIACRILYFYNGIIKHDDGLRQKLQWHSQEAQIWAIATQSEITPRSPISTLAWSPDSTCVAFPWMKQINLIEDGSKIHTTPIVEIWQVSTKRELLGAYEGHTESVIALAWSPDNKFIASASRDGNIHVWEAHSAKCILILETHLSFVFSNFWTPEPTIEWSPDGTLLAFISPSGLIQVWQVV